MKLFTFIVDYEGATCCSQHSGDKYSDAARDFVEYLIQIEVLNLTKTMKEPLMEELLDAVRLDGLVNVYCTSHLVRESDEGIMLINIVETDPKAHDWLGQ